MIFTGMTPKTVEDLISVMDWQQVSVHVQDKGIVSSFNNQALMGRALTVKQGALALKLCRKYRSQLVTLHGVVVDRIIDQEIWGQKL